MPVYPMAMLLLLSSAVTVKLCELPAVVGEGCPLTLRWVAVPATISVPVVIGGLLVFPWQLPASPAVTVNWYVPGCVRPPAGPVFVVGIVSVLEKFTFVAMKGFAPPLNAGRAPVVTGVGVTLSVTVQLVVVPPIVTVVV